MLRFTGCRVINLLHLSSVVPKSQDEKLKELYHMYYLRNHFSIISSNQKYNKLYIFLNIPFKILFSLMLVYLFNVGLY